MTQEASFQSNYRVSMRNIDIFGHVHNSVYLDYCEDAVSDYLRHWDLYSHFQHKENDIGYFVKKAAVTFSHPLDVEDVVRATVSVQKLGNTSLTFGIDIARAKDDKHCALGQLVWVCVDRKSGTPTAIPEVTRSALAI